MRFSANHHLRLAGRPPMGLGPSVAVTCRNQIALPDSASSSDFSQHICALFIFTHTEKNAFSKAGTLIKKSNPSNFSSWGSVVSLLEPVFTGRLSIFSP
ncbi:hypothetical protein NPIL_241641 [Nephila pilipes]|uniref:Uncharacterized protein n=1 Tax=Nephila pilipes TaxID=299642 RepID=A0A8X6N9F7_NEPPI|nr:hypothetical protein NPIL_241641 [Nephila pilipes]